MRDRLFDFLRRQNGKGKEIPKTTLEEKVRTSLLHLGVPAENEERIISFVRSVAEGKLNSKAPWRELLISPRELSREGDLVLVIFNSDFSAREMTLRNGDYVVDFEYPISVWLARVMDFGRNKKGLSVNFCKLCRIHRGFDAFEVVDGPNDRGETEIYRGSEVVVDVKTL